MRIKGRFRADRAPYMTATVVQDALGLSASISFLVDSGASATIIADRDAKRLRIDYSKLQKLQEGMTGIGGTVETFVLPSVKLTFATEERSFEEDMEQIYVLRHPVTSSIQRARIERIPSLLGRDFLNKYTLILKHADDVVLITDEDVMAA